MADSLDRISPSAASTLPVLCFFKLVRDPIQVCINAYVSRGNVKSHERGRHYSLSVATMDDGATVLPSHNMIIDRSHLSLEGNETQ